MHRMEITETVFITQPTSSYKLFGDVLKHYADTLCSAQKQSNLTNSLLQDILIFNGQNATQLEDRLVDIETAADLTAESRTKLAQAKVKWFHMYPNYSSYHIG